MGGRQRCQGRTQTHGGLVGERWNQERLRIEQRSGDNVQSEVGWLMYMFFLSHFTRTFTVASLLFNIVHFQVFGNWGCPEGNNSVTVRNHSLEQHKHPQQHSLI